MKIAILSRDETLYSCRRLREAAHERRHSVDIIDPVACHIEVSSHGAVIYWKGKKLAEYDVVIPRIGQLLSHYGLAILQQFEAMGCQVLNGSTAIQQARDKLKTLQRLAAHKIAIPTTVFAHACDKTDELISMVKGPPVVIKLLEGTQGIGVVLSETRQAAESVIDAFRGLNTPFLVQEFIREAQGSDIRCFVIGNRVVAAMERQAREGDFRSNLHRGGKGIKAHLTAKEREIAVQSAKALGLSVAGVDILRSERGALVMEVNASPGLEGVEGVTGMDVAGMILEYVELKYRTRLIR